MSRDTAGMALIPRTELCCHWVCNHTGPGLGVEGSVMVIKYGAQRLQTYCEIQGIEQDVLACYDTSPAEPDVNWPGGLDLTAVIFEDEGCVMSHMTEEEVSELESRLDEYENDRHNPDNQGE